jgi:hypothetical protein
VLDELSIPDPAEVSLRGPLRLGDIGLGDLFSMPYQTIEAVLPVRGDELAIVNDTNSVTVERRNPALPDYSDFNPRAGPRDCVEPATEVLSTATCGDR